MGCRKLTYYQEAELNLFSSTKELTLKNSSENLRRVYLYGFNGMLKDNQIKGSGNSYDFGARMQDPRIGGRFFSLDPRIKEFPFMSPYLFAGNNPIRNVDENGEGPGDRVKAAKQFLTSKTGYKYSMGSDNIGRKYRTTFTKAALEKQDCIELVTRVLYADGVINSMNVGKYDYYLANKNSIGKLLFNKSKFIQSSTPNVGDIAFWEGHVGIVSEVGKDGKFKLTHAANSRSNILENPYLINASQYHPGTFYGFFRPLNETPDGKTIDITKDINGGKNNTEARSITNTSDNKSNDEIYYGGELPNITISTNKPTKSAGYIKPVQHIETSEKQVIKE